LQVGPAKA